MNDTLRVDLQNTVIVDLHDLNSGIFYIIWPDWRSKVFRYANGVCSDSICDIKVPDDSFYKKFQKKNICPVCLQSKYLIPIVYGLPGNKLLKQADKGKAILAGCIVYENAPKYYCKKDKFEF